MNSSIKPDDIKLYVSVGPREDMSITVRKETFDGGFIALTILFIFGLLLVSGITIYFAYHQANLPPPPPPLVPLTSVDMSLHSNFGAAASENDIISSDNKCNSPFFGPSCSLEKHDQNYYSVGTPNKSHLQLSIIDTISTPRKSFTTDSCSSYCNDLDDCVGFFYEFNVCTLLKDDVFIDSTLPYSQNTNSTLYMKSSDNLHFNQRIFLGAYIHSLPPRYWLVKETPYYLQLTPKEINKILFAPTYVKTYHPYTGIYCTHSFSLNDIPILLKRDTSTNCYIHYPGTDINLPSSWKYKTPLYVSYI